MGAWEVNKFVQDLRKPDVLQAFKENEDIVMEKYDLTEAEKNALKKGNLAEWAQIGMHHILQIVYLQIKVGAAGKHISVKEYLDDLGLFNHS